MSLQWSKRNDFFNINSVGHVYFGFLLTQSLRHYTDSNMKNLFIGTGIHWFEDYLENTGPSLEIFFSRVVGCSKKGWLEPKDNDSLQNHIGDVISHVIGASIAFMTEPYDIKTILILFLLQVIVYITICNHK